MFQLISHAVTLRRDKSISYSRTVLNILLYNIYGYYFEKKLAKGIGLFGSLFHATHLTKIFHLFFFIICAIIILLTAYYPRKVCKTLSSNINNALADWNKHADCNKHLEDISAIVINKMSDQYKILEYSLIILFIITGAILLISSSDLISMFLSIELQSFGLYILSTIYKNSELSTKGGLTYFLLGGLSSCFILLGSGLLYTNTGTTNLDGIYVITSLTGSSNNEISNNLDLFNYINLSLIVITIGFLFKVSAAPFHFWSPDVYDAIPTIVTTFVAITAKISLFIFFIELLHYTGTKFFASDFIWINCLLLSSLLSLIIGSVLGLTQNRIKRLFAYSTINHIGFLLLALTIDSIESIQAFLFYLMQYSISNLNAFLILISIGYTYYLYENHNKSYESLEDKNNSPIQLIKQMKGYFYINSVLAVSLSITLFSFAGIPPLLGFFAKQMVLSAALSSNYIFITFIAILTSVVSAVYYLNIIKEMFFFKGDNVTTMQNIKAISSLASKRMSNLEQNNYFLINKSLVLSNYLSITISVLTLSILVFIFVPNESLNLVNILALNLHNI